MKEDISFDSQGYRLIGTLYKAQEEKASALLIAGGANSHRHDGYYPPLQEEFLKKGITTFNFDFRGVGDAEGIINESNLNTRVEDAVEALKVLRQYSDTKNTFIVGTSMGAPIAIRILDSSTTGLLLVVPAAYSLEARGKNFGPDFSAAVRKFESWKDSPDFDELKGYFGNTFLLYGDTDEVIPKEVLQTYSEIVKANDGEVVVLKNANHRAWFKDEGREMVWAEMSHFILTHPKSVAAEKSSKTE